MDRSRIALSAGIAGLLAAGAIALGFDAWREPPVAREHLLAEGDGLAWYRGNLHAHTRWSDGDAEPADVVAWYRDRGDAFLAITDHDRVPADDEWNALVASAAPGFALIRGEEISNRVGESSVHVNAFGLARTVAPIAASDAVDAIARTAALARAAAPPDAPPLLQLNHPNGWYSVTAEHLMRQREIGLVEIFNAHELANSAGDGLHEPVERLWDIALAWRLDVLGLPVLYGTATDDSHALPGPGARGGRAGRAWVAVLAPRPDAAVLLDALARGRFYASTGVELARIVAAPDRVAVEVATEPDVEYVVEFIGTRRGFPTASTPAASASGRRIHGSRRYSPGIGTVFARFDGPRGQYRFGPDDLYVRARVTSSRPHPDPGGEARFEQAWTQPVVGPAGASPGRRGEPVPPAVPAALHAMAHRFAPIRGSARAALANARVETCGLDLVATGDGRATTTFAAVDRAMFGGWVADAAAGRPPESITVVLDGAADYEAAGGTTRSRPDVAAALRDEAFEVSGFTVDFSLADVAPGEYAVVLVAHGAARSVECRTGRRLQVR